MANWSKTFNLEGVEVRFVLPEFSSRRIWRGSCGNMEITLWKDQHSGLWEANLYSGETRVTTEGKTMLEAASSAMFEWKRIS